MKIDFYPRAVEKTLSEIRTKHPTLKSTGSSIVAQTIIDKVRTKLLACPTDELKKIALDLIPEEIKACVYLLNEQEVSLKAVEVILQRPRKGVLIDAWKRWIQTYPGPPKLEDVVRGLIEKFGTETLIERAVAPKYVSEWLMESRLSSGILSHYHRLKRDSRLDAYLFTSNVKEEDRLFYAVWHRLLTTGTGDQLLHESPERILMEFMKPTTGGADKQSYCRHYLNVLKKQALWQESILNFIAKRYGRPSNQGQIEDAFWSGIDEGVKGEFLKWYISKQIADFFEGERANFWRYFVHIRTVCDVRNILNGNGFMLDFGSFGVVEFKAIGNAAYVYPKDIFKRYWNTAHRYATPGDFKDRAKTVSSRFWDGRITHPSGWQPHAKELIEKLIKSI